RNRLVSVGRHTGCGVWLLEPRKPLGYVFLVETARKDPEWVRYPLNCPDAPQWQRWLLIRRHPDEKEDYAYYSVYAPKVAPLTSFVRVAGARWAVERCFQEAKGEVGLDHYEVRSWTGWH